MPPELETLQRYWRPLKPLPPYTCIVGVLFPDRPQLLQEPLLDVRNCHW